MVNNYSIFNKNCNYHGLLLFTLIIVKDITYTYFCQSHLNVIIHFYVNHDKMTRKTLKFITKSTITSLLIF